MAQYVEVVDVVFTCYVVHCFWMDEFCITLENIAAMILLPEHE